MCERLRVRVIVTRFLRIVRWAAARGAANASPLLAMLSRQNVRLRSVLTLKNRRIPPFFA
jgi:hypothetical protein